MLYELITSDVLLYKPTQKGQYQFVIYETINHLSETVEGSTCLISKTLLI